MAGKLCWALGLVLLFAAAVLTQAPLAVGLLGFFLLLTLLLVQIALGLANVHLALPLANALAHNLVAAHLLVCCVLARGRLSRPRPSPLLSPEAIRSQT